MLSIETSCDETAIAVVRKDGERFVVEKDLVASQIKEHAKYGGVVPEVAARMHMEALFPMLEESGVPRDGSGIDGVAVTAGPGLVVALRVGVETAKALSVFWQKPLVAVNHLEGHILSAWLGTHSPSLPLLALLVSGGHTEFILVPEIGTYRVIGQTRDDAAGEAFDKVAKLLELGYPGGPAVSKIAAQGSDDAIAFPRPMLDQENLDVSFSGLKTAVLKEVRSGSHRPMDVAASFEAAVVDTLIEKMRRAVEQTRPASLALVGGVSANRRLRARFQTLAHEHNLVAHIPDVHYCTDNAVMIAVAGAFALERGDIVDPLKLKPDPDLPL